MSQRDIIYWPVLCGNTSQDDAFWNENVTLNTEEPDLMSCFQDTVLVWIPCAFMWLLSIGYIPWLCHRPRYHGGCERSRLNATKIVVGSLLCAVSCTELLDVFVFSGVQDDRASLAQQIKPALQLATYILATFLASYEYQKGVHTGGVLFLFWMFSVVLDVVPFRSLIRHITYNNQGRPQMEHVLMFCLFYIRYGLMLIQFVLVWFADKSALEKAAVEEERRPLLGAVEGSEREHSQKKRKKPCPLSSCSYLSWLTFSWITPLILYGYKHPLVYDDLSDIVQEDTSAMVHTKFECEWKKELVNTRFRLVASERQQEDVSYKGRKPRQPSMWRAIVGTFGWYYAGAGFFKLSSDLTGFLTPILLNLLINFVSSDNPHMWQGYTLAIALFVVSVVKSILMQHYWYACFRTGLRLRTSLIAMIYRKSLRLNNTARKSASVGEIVNLMAVDVQKLQEAASYMHMVWSTPLTIGISLYMLSGASSDLFHWGGIKLEICRQSLNLPTKAYLPYIDH